EGQVPFLGADVVQALVGALDGGVVDENVETAELLERALHQPPAMPRIGDVARYPYRPPARLLDPAGGLCGILVLLAVGDQHIGALAGEGDGDRTADAGIAAGDDGRLAMQPAAAAIALLAVIGLRVHFAGSARRALLLGRIGRLGLR